MLGMGNHALITDAPVPLEDYVPEADQRIVMRGQNWASYKALLAVRGDRRGPRIDYLDGVVQLMTPSRRHEFYKSGLGRLLEAWCTEHRIKYTPYGSWTLDDESEQAAVEADESYVFGDDPDSVPLPQLAIEIVWTSGGINKLEIYRRLGVREVWFWKRLSIAVHVLGAEGYEQRAASARFPDLDLTLLCRLAATTPVSDAVAELQRILRDRQ